MRYVFLAVYLGIVFVMAIIIAGQVLDAARVFG